MKVLDISPGIAGRYCAQLLTLLGADVTRVDVAGVQWERPLGGDPLIDEVLDRGKTRLALDWHRDDERARLAGLVREADALVEDAGPAGMAALALDDAVLFAHRPALVLTHISEFGPDGPWAHWRGSELINLAAGGMLFLTGSCERPPVQLAPSQAQLTTGVLAAIATAAALYSGGPMTIDLSKQEAVMALLSPSLTNYAYTGVIDAREGTVAGMTRIERAADRWVYAGPSAPGNADYGVFSRFLNVPELAQPRFATVDARMEHWEEHQALIVPRLRQRTEQEWIDEAERWRLTFGHVQTTSELLDCPVLAEREFFAGLPMTGGIARVPLAPYLVDGHRPGELSQDAATTSMRETAPASGD